MTSLIADLLARLDDERRYEFEERAGTIEFDSGVPRDQAERLALIDLRTYPGALIGVTALEVSRDCKSQFVITTDRSENGFEGSFRPAPSGSRPPCTRSATLSFGEPGTLTEACAAQYHVLREHTLDHRGDITSEARRADTFLTEIIAAGSPSGI